MTQQSSGPKANPKCINTPALGSQHMSLGQKKTHQNNSTGAPKSSDQGGHIHLALQPTTQQQLSNQLLQYWETVD
jgi:hypothetical protein